MTCWAKSRGTALGILDAIATYELIHSLWFSGVSRYISGIYKT
jgi:hypothetical protein